MFVSKQILGCAAACRSLPPVARLATARLALPRASARVPGGPLLCVVAAATAPACWRVHHDSVYKGANVDTSVGQSFAAPLSLRGGCPIS